MDGNLDSLLGQLREGGQLDSSGTFTLDLRKARDKLRQYQLAEPCFYLLKLVQAGVAAQASRIDLHLGRLENKVQFSLPPGNCLADSSQLFELLTDPQSAPPGAQRHLAIGLNSSWAIGPSSVTWTYWPSRGSGWSVRINAQEIQLNPAPERPILRPYGDVAEFCITEGVSLQSLVINPSRHRQVLYRCGFCPVPLYLDGRRVIGQWSRAAKPQSASLGGAYLVTERFLLSDGGFALCAPPWKNLTASAQEDTQLQTQEVSGGEDFRFPSFAYQLKRPPGIPEPPQEDTLICRMALAVAHGFCGESRMVIVKDGVTLEPLPLPQHLANKGVQVIVAADVAVDLSEFRALDLNSAEIDCYQLAAQELNRLVTEMLPVCHLAPHHQQLVDGESDFEWVYRWLAHVFPKLKEGSWQKRRHRQAVRNHLREGFLQLRQFQRPDSA